MRTRFNTDEATGRTNQTNEGRKRNVVPSHVVNEKCEVVRSTAAIGHDPERNDNSEETSNVKNDDETFDERKLLGKEGVEEVADG